MKETDEKIELIIAAGTDKLLEYGINFDDPSAVVQSVLIACLSAHLAHGFQNKMSADLLEIPDQPPSTLPEWDQQQAFLVDLKALVWTPASLPQI